MIGQVVVALGSFAHLAVVVVVVDFVLFLVFG